MAGLLTDAQKAALGAQFSSMAQTFERNIVVYQEAEKTVVSSNPSFTRLNAANQNNTDIENEPVLQTIPARILYGSKMTNEFAQLSHGDLDFQKKLKMSEGIVRIKVRATYYNFFKDAKKVELDGQLFDVDTVERPHGLFNVDFYTFWLKRSQ